MRGHNNAEEGKTNVAKEDWGARRACALPRCLSRKVRSDSPRRRCLKFDYGFIINHFYYLGHCLDNFNKTTQSGMGTNK